MIKHHPNDTILKQFVAGELPATVSLIVSSHVEMCKSCQKHVASLTRLAAEQSFEVSDNLISYDVDTPELDSDNLSLIDMITALPIEQPSILPKTVTEIEVSNQRVALPRAIRSIALKEWKGLGKLSRSRLDIDDGDLRASLLHIDKGGSVPSHSHDGFEITLLLQGSFKDEMGTYSTGDFIWLDGKHTHHPVTDEGCVCLTVSSDAIHFTQGMSKMLNPIGKFIY